MKKIWENHKNIILLVGSIFLAAAVSETVLQFAVDDDEKHSGETKKCTFIERTSPDPYMGYVLKHKGICAQLGINRQGFSGGDFFRKDAGNYTTIMAGGGSASYLLAETGFLEHVLNYFFIPWKGKKFRTLNAAAGAWHLPMHFNAFVVYRHIVDAFIGLDGYNEHWNFEGTDRDFIYPTNEVKGAWNINTNLAFAICQAVYLKIESTLSADSFFYRMMLSRLSLQALQKALAKLAFVSMESNEVKSHLSDDRYLLPEYIVESGRQFEYRIERYKDYIRMIRDIAGPRNIKTAHFIQPVPMIGKKLTESEMESVKKIHKDINYAESYQKMAGELLNLEGENINIFSLLDIFNNESGEIYYDHIHASTKGLKMMACMMADKIREAWKLMPKKDREFSPNSCRGFLSRFK